MGRPGSPDGLFRPAVRAVLPPVTAPAPRRRREGRVELSRLRPALLPTSNNLYIQMRIISKTFTVLAAALLPLWAVAGVAVTGLLTEGMESPLGLGTPLPRFSWRIESGEKGVLQTAYQIEVASTEERLGRGEADLWRSGRVESARQLWIAYGGRPLPGNSRGCWRVRVFTNRGASAWSSPQHFGTGLLGETDWRGRWIGLERLMSGERRGLHTRLAARYLRREFRLDGGPVRRATAYVAGLGLYRLYVNGSEVGASDVLKPAPTDYRKTIFYDAYDVTQALDSLTAVGIVLGNGRYFPMRQDKPWKVPVFGLPTCRLNIIVEYADGHTQRLVTDETWRVTADGPVRANNEYDGEEYDARMELGGWTMPGYDDSRWAPAERSAVPTGTLRGRVAPPMEARPAGRARLVGSAGGRAVLDFGRNMAGWVAFTPRGAAGDTIRLRYAERLNPDGTLYTDNLRDARSEDVYVCSGRERGPWQPSFVYHGFRYVEVTGAGRVAPADFTAYSVADRMGRGGTFACSDSTLTQVVEAARRGIESNYKGMPVDCPQRNERQPWLGDRTAGAAGESRLFSNGRLYAKWVADICEAQREDGCIPDVAPAFWNYYTDDVTWPAALPMVCDMLLERQADTLPVRRAYPAMARWMRHILATYGRGGLVAKDKYGDWCVPPESPRLIHSEDPARQTDGTLIATAYTIRCLGLLEKFARLLGLGADAAGWRSRREGMAEAFNGRFLTVRRGTSPAPGHPLYPDSVFYGNNTATANVLALAFGIAPDSLRGEIAKNLVAGIMSGNGGHIPTGVIGTSWLLTTLTDNGFADVACLLATNRTYPSWGYMVDRGATTIWELWNGDTADPAMNSGNHVMLLGDLLEWCFGRLAGIGVGGRAPSGCGPGGAAGCSGGWAAGAGAAGGGAKPGHRADMAAAAGRQGRADFTFTLIDQQQIDSVAAACESPYGRVASRWRRSPGRVDWTVEVPCNTTADVCLPGGTVRRVGSGSHHFSVAVPPADSAIVADEFLYASAPFPECHAPTIVETRDGDLVAAFFGGTRERNPDVCIWVSRKEKGSGRWTAPVLAADGVFEPGSADALLAGITDSTTDASAGPVLPYHRGGALKRKACWNPVLFEMPDGELWLFFKIGLRVADWTGWVVKSNDGGRTWGRREPLPKGFLGPVKNKPEMVDGRLVCGSSTETGGWKLHFEIYDTATGEWTYVGPIAADDAPRTEDTTDVKPIDCIQPSILRLAGGRLKVLCRTRNGRLATSESADGGLTWSRVELTALPSNQSGTDAVTLAGGGHALVYNDFATLPGTKKGPRTPLCLAVSADGQRWSRRLTLEDSPVGEYSYPAVIQGRDGLLHCVYTWRRRRVAYKCIDPARLGPGRDAAVAPR